MSGISKEVEDSYHCWKRRSAMKTIYLMIVLLFTILICGGNAFAEFEGNNNTFYGTIAGVNTADDNDADTIVGGDAGLRKTTGSSNTFVGENAGRNNVEASYNTFIGADAGLSNSNNNTFLGLQSGFANREGKDNILGRRLSYINVVQ